MAERFDVVSFKKTQSGKTFAVKLGSATARTNGPGFNLWLDAIPAPVDGQYQLCVVPQRDQPREDIIRKSGSVGGPDDEMPF